MSLSTASELSLLEFLERKLKEQVTVSRLAEIERELFRLRSKLGCQAWNAFRTSFPTTDMFQSLDLGHSPLRRTSGCSLAYLTDALDSLVAEPFQARPLSQPSPAHVISGWEYSLPVSRSIRARRQYFSREIADIMRTVMRPRILVLGPGKLREIDQALHSEGVEITALTSDIQWLEKARRLVPPLFKIEFGGRDRLSQLADRCGTFDLIYSPGWLDTAGDLENVEWLSDAMELLKPHGRILAANFAPDSRDCGWTEACWNWSPHYRSEEELAQLVMKIQRPEARVMVRGHAVFRDESGASTFLDLQSI